MQEKKTSRLFLISSVVLGVLGAVVSFAYLQTSAGVDRGPKVRILVAKHDLRENATLNPDLDFDEMEIPSRMTALAQRALRPEDRGAYKGQRVNRRVLAGTPLLLADLVAAADLTVKGDRRALSITVKGAQGLSNLLIPGDWIKLYVAPMPRTARYAPTTEATEPTAQPMAPPRQAMAILPEPVKVLAVGARLARTRQQITLSDQLAAAPDSDSQQTTTVTVDVTEAQIVQILSYIGAVGPGQESVTVVLCPPQPTTNAK